MSTSDLQIGFGTWKIENDAAMEIISESVRAGYRHFDLAASYANESGVGKGLLQSGTDRGELLISDKLWVTRRPYHLALKACRQSLKNLKLSYFDQYLIHFPATPYSYSNWEEINQETWKAMEELKNTGLARKIGLCNFRPNHMDALLSSAAVMPAVNQIEMHPGLFPADTVEYCQAHHIQVEAWSPLGNGQLIHHEMLQELSMHYQKTVSQICLRWCIQHGAVPIVKASSFRHMTENLNIMDFEISEQDMNRIDHMEPCAFSGIDPDRNPFEKAI